MLSGLNLKGQVRWTILPPTGISLPGQAWNAPGSNNPSSCLVDTIILTSQSAIDNFAANYPSCTNPKYLFIDGTGASPAITSLAGLSGLNQILHKLRISHTSITSLSDLNNLTLIGDTLELQHNVLLTQIGLYNLDSLGSIVFTGHPLLNSIDGLSNNLNTIKSIHIDSAALTNLNGLSGIDSITGGNLELMHTQLVNLSSLSGLTTILNGYLYLEVNPNMTSIGLNNLTRTWGFLFGNMPNLTSIAGLSNNLVNTNIGTFWMNNTGLTNLTGMDSITSSSNFYLFSNPNLTSLHGLEKLSGNIGGGITIYNNPVLTDVTALQNVTEINDAKLEIAYCNDLSDLTGLGNITTIGNGLWINGNGNLQTLASLNSGLIIQNLYLDSVRITNNGQLAICSFAPICSYLAGNGGAIIENNAPGCSTIAEVVTICNNNCPGGNESTWNGINSDDWNDAGNWTPSGVPTYCTKVTIPSATPNSPLAAGNISIGGLIMENGSSLDMNNFELQVTRTFNLENASLLYASHIIVTRAYAPGIQSSTLVGDFTLQDYGGFTEIIGNYFNGNTILSDSTGRTESSSTFFNNFYGDLTFTNNSNYGNNYLSNASPSHDYVQGNLTVYNNSTANISVGLGGGNPLWVNGNFTVNASSGRVDINNFTFVDGADAHIIQTGTLPVEINNLYMQKNGGDVYLDSGIHILQKLQLDDFGGFIFSDTNKLLTLENNCIVNKSVYGGSVLGPVKKIGNQGFTFPIGVFENNTYWSAPLTISAPSSATDEFTAQYFHHNPGNDGYDTSLYTPGFGGISGKEYWKLNRNNGSSTVSVTLSYDSSRSGPALLYEFLQVAGWNGSLWRNWGTGGFNGNMSAGTVITNGPVTGYGPMTLSFKPIRKPVITLGNVDSIPCAGTYFPVPFSLDTLMITGNIFSVQISDSLGNFSNGFNPSLGSKVSVSSDTILAYMPFILNWGSHYKIRVVGNLPRDTSINTKTVIPSRVPQLNFSIIGPAPSCIGNGVQKYYPSIHESNTNYSWTLSGGGTFTTSGDTANVTWTTTGFHTLFLTSSNHCGNGLQKFLTVEVRPPSPTDTPAINNTGRWLYSSLAPAWSGYQWYRNGSLIAGATNAAYYASLAGAYTIRYANFCGNGPVSNTISFAANSIPQTIIFPAMADKTYGDAPFVPNATASSGLPVALIVLSGPASINAQTNLLTITGTGLVTVKASQIGDNVYDTAAPVTRSFTVNKAPQTITFQSIPEQNISNGSVALNASSSSGLPVIYSQVSGPATVSGNLASFTGLGTVTVRAAQSGDTNYLPATPVDRSFCTRVFQLNPISGFTLLCPGAATYSVNMIPGATYFWRIAGGAILPSTSNTAIVTWSTPGTYSLLVSASGPCGAASANDTLVVTVINSIQPDSVHTMLPPNGAINQQLPLTLSWVPAQPNLFYTFDLYLWRADLPQPGTPYAANLTSVNYVIPVNSGLLTNQPYKWMVVAHNGSCTPVNTGPIQQFTLIPLPDLKVQNVQAPTSAFSGQTIAINWTVRNIGPGHTTTNQNWTDAVFLSFDTIPNFSLPPNTNPGAWSQLSFPIRTLLIATRPNVSALDSGQQYSNSVNFTLPANYSQPLYVYVISNYPAGTQAPQQVSLVNDTARTPLPVIVTLSPTPDLRVDTVFTPNTLFSGSTISLTYKVKNYGVLTPSGSTWTDKVYISQSPIFNINSAIPVKLPRPNGSYYPNPVDAFFLNNTQLLGDSSYTRNIQVVVPNFIFGSYFIYVFTNVTNTLYEGALANNNTNRSLVQVFLTPTPHLTVNLLTVPVTSASTTQPIGVNWNISNTGFNDNIEKNKGHYIVPFSSCSIPSNGTPGILFRDSLGFGSSYWVDRTYLSTDSTGLNTNTAILVNETSQGIFNSGLSAGDNLFLFDCKILGTNPGQFNVNTFNVVRSGSNHPQSGNFTVPSDLQPGNYFVYVLANAAKTVYEYPGTPETKRSVLPISIQRPDATVSSVTVPVNGTGGQPITIQYSILNTGPGSVFNHVRRDKVYVSSSPVFDGSAQLISTQIYTENLTMGTPVSHSLSHTFPVSTSGTRYFYVHTNFDSAFRETNPNNNISTGAAIVMGPATANDLVVSNIQLADTVYTIYPTYFRYAVTNNGSGTTAGTWTDSLFISCNSTFSPATSYYIGKRTHNEVITTGGSYADSFNLNIRFAFYINNCFPQVTNSLAYFFIKTNADNVVYEGANGNNNVTGTGIRVLINPLVDHIVTNVTGPDTATVARPFATTWTVKNLGYNPGTQYYNGWYDAIYLSPDSIRNGNDILAANYQENSPLNTNQAYTDTRNVIIPNIPTGDYYVMAITNFNSYLGGEFVINNNTNFIRNGSGAAKKIHIIQPSLPDLADSILYAPTVAAVGQPMTITNRISNIGPGVTYPANWSDYIWLSTDFVPGNGGDITLSAKNHVGALQPGQSYDDTSNITLGLNIVPGNYVLIHKTNATGNVFETNSANNLAFRYITIYRPAPSDLIVESISKPDTVVLGNTLDSAKWVIRNNSANAASGVSSDGIYLSQSNVLDSTAVLLGIKHKNINMGPLSNDSIFLRPLVDNVPEGNYHLIVKTDLLNNIVESDKTNNTGISATQIYVKVNVLPMNVLTLNTLYNVNRYYKLVIPDSLSGSTILVTLKSGDSLTMKNQLFIGKGYIPSAAHFDYTYSTPNYGNQEIFMSSVTAGNYYITVRCVSASPVIQNITLKAVKLPFAILNVHTNSGGNIGNVTVKITGSLYTNNMTARLSKPGTTIVSSAVYFSNSTTVYATFNLQGKPLGIYDLSLIKPDSAMATLVNGFSVVNANNGGINNGGGVNTGAGNGNAPGCDPGAAGGINSQLVTEMVIPDKVFAGWPFVIQINYNNPTNMDVPAQVRILYSESGILMALTPQGVNNGTTSLYLELTEPGGPPGIIRAGGSGTVTVYAKAPLNIPAHTFVFFNLK